jgi:hypothetical protein
MWALSEPSAVLLWQLGIASSSVAAVIDACTGRRIVLSGFVLIAPLCAALTGRWLRTAVAGAWAIFLILVLGVPDGIWGTRLETSLIGIAVIVAVSSTLGLLITFRGALSLAATGLFAAGCSSHEAPPARPAVSPTRPVSCRQQSETWKNSPGPAQMSELATTLKTIRTAENSANVPALMTDMKKLTPASLVLARYPIPLCVDPAGLYIGLVERIAQAGYDARSATGPTGLLKAAATLKGLKTTESRLTAEVNHVLATGS